MQKAKPVDIFEVPPSFVNLDDLDNNPEAVASIQHILQVSRRPAVFRGFNLGPCTKTWTPEYLKSVNPEKKVKIHRSQTPQLDFRNKNFKYETVTFSELIEHCSSSGDSQKDYLYLRSLGDD